MHRHKRISLQKKMKPSSQAWMLRHLNDPYVNQAIQEGYRSRAVYKLIHIDQKIPLFKPGLRVLDVGCAPGSWCQLLARRFPSMKLCGVDLLPVQPLSTVTFIQGDITDVAVQSLLKKEMSACDILLSDSAPSTIGHGTTDHIRMMVLLEKIWAFGQQYLAKQGHLVFKVFQGQHLPSFVKELRPLFHQVRLVKPLASRSFSAETYLVATDYKGDTTDAL
jgi:23S rRNA (uridine2552-2'-O)-methyltransferase